MLSNVNMSGAPGALASGAEIIKPFTFIIMSSRVSENIWLTVSIAFCRAVVEMPVAPIHKVSFVPIANNSVFTVPMRGLFFTV